MIYLQERKHSHYCHEEEELVELESNICICYLNLISAPIKLNFADMLQKL